MTRRQIPLRDRCPDRDQHTPAPARYVAWHGWAEDMAKTHEVEKCPTCELWVIWTPRVVGRRAAGQEET